jgi:hypothetical protein
VVTKLWPLRQIKLLIEKGFKLREYSPEKAGVGGSTPSLATMISITYKQLGRFRVAPKRNSY